MFIGLVESGDAAVKGARGLSVFKRRWEVGSQFALGVRQNFSEMASSGHPEL